MFSGNVGIVPRIINVLRFTYPEDTTDNTSSLNLQLLTNSPISFYILFYLAHHAQTHISKFEHKKKSFQTYPYWNVTTNTHTNISYNILFLENVWRRGWGGFFFGGHVREV